MTESTVPPQDVLATGSDMAPVPPQDVLATGSDMAPVAPETLISGEAQKILQTLKLAISAYEPNTSNRRRIDEASLEQKKQMFFQLVENQIGDDAADLPLPPIVKELGMIFEKYDILDQGKSNLDEFFVSDILDTMIYLLSSSSESKPEDWQKILKEPFFWRMARRATRINQVTAEESDKQFAMTLATEMLQSPDLLKRELMPKLFMHTLQCVQLAVNRLPSAQQTTEVASQRSGTRLTDVAKKRLEDRQSTHFLEALHTIESNFKQFKAQSEDQRVPKIRTIFKLVEKQLENLGEYKQLEIGATEIVLKQVVEELVTMGLIEEKEKLVNDFSDTYSAIEHNLLTNPTHRENRAVPLINSNSIVLDAFLSLSQDKKLTQADAVEMFELCLLPPHPHYKRNEFLLSQADQLPTWFAGETSKQKATAVLYIENWLESFWNASKDSAFLAEIGFDPQSTKPEQYFISLAEMVVDEKAKQLQKQSILAFDKLGEQAAQKDNILTSADFNLFLEKQGISQQSWLAIDIKKEYLRQCAEVSKALLTIDPASVDKKLQQEIRLEKQKIVDQQEKLRDLLATAEKLSRPQSMYVFGAILEKKIISFLTQQGTQGALFNDEQASWLTEWLGIAPEDFQTLEELITEAVGYVLVVQEPQKSNPDITTTTLAKMAALLLLPNSAVANGAAESLKRTMADLSLSDERRANKQKLNKKIFTQQDKELFEKKLKLIEIIEPVCQELFSEEKSTLLEKDPVIRAFELTTKSLRWSLLEIRKIMRQSGALEEDIALPALLQTDGMEALLEKTNSILKLKSIDSRKKRHNLESVTADISQLQEYCIKANTELLPQELKTRLFTIVLKDFPTIVTVLQTIGQAEMAQVPLVPPKMQEISSQNPINQALAVLEILTKRVGTWGTKLNEASLQMISSSVFTYLHGKRIKSVMERIQKDAEGSNDPIGERWRTFSGVLEAMSEVFEEWWKFEIARKGKKDMQGKEQERMQTATSALAQFATKTECTGKKISKRSRSGTGLHLMCDMLRFFTNTHPESGARVEMPLTPTATGEYSILLLSNRKNKAGEIELFAKKIIVPLKELDTLTSENDFGRIDSILNNFLSYKIEGGWQKVSKRDIATLNQRNTELLESMPTALRKEKPVKAYTEKEYLDTANTWCAHGIITFTDSSQGQPTSLENKLNQIINPYTTGGAFAAEIGLPSVEQQASNAPDAKVTLDANFNHSYIDGATVEKWLPKVLQTTVEQAPKISADSDRPFSFLESDTFLSLEAKSQVLPSIPETAANHTKIKEYVFTSEFIQSAAQEIFPFFYNKLGITEVKLTTHTLKLLVLQAVFNSTAHWLEKSASGALTPVVQIASPETLTMLRQPKEELFANPEAALRNFKELFLKENIANTTQRAGAKQRIGLNLVSTLADIGGSGYIRDLLARFAQAPGFGIYPLTDMLTFSQGLLAPVQRLLYTIRSSFLKEEKPSNSNLFLVSDIAPNNPKKPEEENLENITAKQTKFTTADTRNYAFTVGSYQDTDGNIVLSIRTNPRTPQEIQDKLPQIENLLAQAEKDILEYFKVIKKIISDNEALAYSVLFSQE